MECITMMLVASSIPFSFFAPCDDMLAMLVCATQWLSMHLYMLAYLSMHKSFLLVCHPCFNTMKLWTSDPNLHLSLADTTLFICYLFCSFACIHAMLAMSIVLTHFMLFHMLFELSFHCLSASFFVFAFACTHMERGKDKDNAKIMFLLPISKN